MLKKDGILLNLKKERQMLMLFSSRILLCWHTNDVGNFIHSERLEVFLKDIIPWKTFPVFFLVFDLDWKTGFHCQKDLFFSFWKTSNWFRKTCCFLFWKTFFIRKTWMLKKDMSFLQKDMNFYFQKDWLL